MKLMKMSRMRKDVQKSLNIIIHDVALFLGVLVGVVGNFAILAGPLQIQPCTSEIAFQKGYITLHVVRYISQKYSGDSATQSSTYLHH